MKKYTSNTRSITALPRSKRLRQAGVSATAVQSAAYESGDWLPRSVWDSVFTVADDGTLRVRTDLLVTGGVTMYADSTAEGGSGSGGVIVVDGLESTMTDAALSANMGRVLKEMIDNKSTVTTWAQLEGKPTTIAGFGITDAYTKAQTASLLAGYLTTEAAAATYVTLDTEQTLTGAKTFAALATFGAGATVSADQTLTVGGVTLSRHSDGTLFVDGNIVVSGGVTIYGDGGASGGSGGGVLVVDGLESTMTDAALSANMGRVLKEMIDNKSTVTTWAQLEGKPTTIAGFGITDAPTKTGAGASGTWGISVSGSASRLAELINNDNVVQLYRGVRTDGTLERRIYDDGWSLIIERLKSADTITVQTGGIWVQGGSAAGGDNTRMALTGGMPSDLAYNGGKRGLRLYSNAIALADPYNGNSNNDAAWIRHLETTANSGILEIAVGDDAAENIVVRQYNINNQVAKEAYLLNGSGDTLFPGKVTAASIYTNGYVFSNSGWFQNNAANTGLYNAAGDARFYYDQSTTGWRSDKRMTASDLYSTGAVYSTASFIDNNTDGDYVSAMTSIFPNLGSGHCSNILIGKAASKYNSAYIGYVHTSDGASSNYLTLGLHSQDRVINLTASGNTGIGTIAPEAKLHIYNTTYPNIKMTTADQECSIYYENGWGRGWAAGPGCWGYPQEFVIGEYKTVSAWRLRLDASGNLLVAGGITMYSDLRKKTAIEDVELRLDEIADAPLFSHVYKDDDKRTLHVGSSAQYWHALCPGWFTREDTDGYYMMEIQNCALAAAISLGREVRRYERNTDKQIRKLKRRVAELEDEIAKIKKNQQNNA